MPDRLYFQELHDLISQIWPQLVGHYVPIVAFIMDPRDQDNVEPEDCARLVVGDRSRPCHPDTKKSRKWAKLDFLFTSKLLRDTLAGLEDDVDPDEREELEKLEEAFHQVGNPSYFEATLKKIGWPTDDAGEIFFSTSQSLGTISDYRGLRDSGIKPNELRQRYRKELTLDLVDCLLGPPKTEATPYFSDGLYSDISSPRPRKRLCSAFLTALLKQELPEVKNHILLCSDVVQFPHRRDCRQFFVAVDPKHCLSVLPLLQPTFSDKDNSFLQQVIQILFQKWQDIHRFALYHTNAYDMIDTDAVIRLAIRDLTEGCGLPPYTLFNQISATYSEGSVCHGTLAFSEEATVENLISFEKPILLQTETVRYVRKLLEMTNGGQDDDYVLFVNIASQSKPRILGLAPRLNCKNLYTVEFYGLVKWTLLKAGHEMVSYQDGKYLYRQKHFDNDLGALSRFLGCTDEDMGAIRYIVECAWEQKHGTMLVIFRETEDAVDEAERLVGLSRGIRLEAPQNFAKMKSKKLLLSLSSIDGAILLDRTGAAFGFGIIVDGHAIEKGTPERGARYNSAKNYVACCEDKKRPCAALVISEDHSLDVLLSSN